MHLIKNNLYSLNFGDHCGKGFLVSIGISKQHDRARELLISDGFVQWEDWVLPFLFFIFLFGEFFYQVTYEENVAFRVPFNYVEEIFFSECLDGLRRIAKPLIWDRIIVNIELLWLIIWYFWYVLKVIFGSQTRRCWNSFRKLWLLILVNANKDM